MFSASRAGIRACGWLLTGGVLAWASPAAVAGQDPPPDPAGPVRDPAFVESVDVPLFRVPVRAVDHRGAPLEGLSAADFQVLVGRREVPVVAVDWVPAGRVWPEKIDGVPARAAQGRLVVLFVQWSQHPHRASGLRRLLRVAPEILAGLEPADRLAVVSFEHGLLLRSDFTRDRARTLEALHDAVVGTTVSSSRHAAPPDPARPSLARSWDDQAAARAHFVEDGLDLVANTLAALPGDKLLYFFGWGLGIEHGGDPTPRYRRAAAALLSADVPVHALALGRLGGGSGSNLDRAVSHIASDTGGIYARLESGPTLAVQRLRLAPAGHYDVFFEALPGVEGPVKIRLREGPYRLHHGAFAVRDEGRKIARGAQGD